MPLTTHYDDFVKLQRLAFGEARVIFFGCKRAHENEFIAYATNWRRTLVFKTDTGPPEGIIGTALVDIGALKWGEDDISTTNYSDFCTVAQERFGGACAVICGSSFAPRHNQFTAYATDSKLEFPIIYIGNAGQPDDFAQVFGNIAVLADIDAFQWKYRRAPMEIP